MISKSKRLKITATLILDEFAWVRNDITAQEWMINEIVLGDDLRVISPEIGDEIGILIVHSAKDSKPCPTCDDRQCMDCVLRHQHDRCENTCPRCGDVR